MISPPEQTTHSFSFDFSRCRPGGYRVFIRARVWAVRRTSSILSVCAWKLNRSL